MRPISLLFGALVLLPLAVEGQATTPGTTPASVTVSPVDVVAERVRSILFGDPNRASLIELAEILPETSIGTSERVAADVVVSDADESGEVEGAVAATASAAADLEPVVASAVSDAEPSVSSDAGDLLEADVLADNALETDVQETLAPVTTGLPEGVVPDGGTATAEVLDVAAMGPAWTTEAPLPVASTLVEAEVSFGDRLRTINVETLFRVLAGLFLLVATATFVARRGDGIALKPAIMSRRGPVIDARALVAKGVPLHEVTRRTGLGRDALALLAHRKPS